MLSPAFRRRQWLRGPMGKKFDHAAPWRRELRLAFEYARDVKCQHCLRCKAQDLHHKNRQRGKKKTVTPSKIWQMSGPDATEGKVPQSARGAARCIGFRVREETRGGASAVRPGLVCRSGVSPCSLGCCSSAFCFEVRGLWRSTLARTVPLCKACHVAMQARSLRAMKSTRAQCSSLGVPSR